MTDVEHVVNRLTTLARLLKPVIGGLTIVLSADGRVLPPDNHVTDPPPCWTDPGLASQLYDELRGYDPAVFCQALIEAARAPEGRRKVIQTAIKLGIPRSLDTLEMLLDRYGSRQIAEDYLNCEIGRLQSAAQTWCRGHNFVITYFGSGGRATWGSF
jgi:hypothetical protein